MRGWQNAPVHAHAENRLFARQWAGWCVLLQLSATRPLFLMPVKIEIPPVEVCRLLPKVIEPFAVIGEQDAMLVASMMRGEMIGTIAKRHGLNYESVFLRWQKVKRHNPAFGALANGLMGCGRGRKPKAVKA